MTNGDWYKKGGGKGDMAHGRTTSKRVAKKASKILRSKRSSKTAKSVAGSALSQKHGRGRKKR